MRHAAAIFATVCAATFVVRAAEVPPPTQVRVLLQFVEVSHPALTEWMAGADTSGKALHANAIALVKAGQAKVLESVVITTRIGQQATVESVREFTYPTEYEPPGFWTLHSRVAPAEFLSYRTPSCWDTRMLGVTVEVIPDLSADGRHIELVVIPEIVEQTGERMWNSWFGPHGRYDIKTPDFRTMRTKLDVTLTPGVFEMVTVLNPAAAAPVPAVLRKVLVFVRCDVLSAGK